MDYQGLPKSTYYYRRKHPKFLSRSAAAAILGMTPESLSRIKKRLHLSRFEDVVKIYQDKKAASRFDYEIVPVEEETASCLTFDFS